MLTEEEFREELHRRLDDRLGEVRAPTGLVDGVRARQARRAAVLRGTSAASVVAAVVAAVTAGLLIRGATHSPSPGSSPVASPKPTNAAVSVVPSPSTQVVTLSGVAPLVTSGPCKGLAIGVYQWSRDLHPPVTALTRSGVTLTVAGGGGLSFKAGGPCVDRLAYVQRTGTFQDLINEPRSFSSGSAGVVAESSPQNQTGLVQFFLDCRGLVCSGSGAPLATLTVHARGTSPAARAVPFAVLPSPLPLPPGEPVTIPSVLGMTPEKAQEALQKAGVNEVAVTSDSNSNTGTVTFQDPAAGSVVIRGGGESLGVTGGQPFTPPPVRTAPPGVAPPSAFNPDAGGDVPFIHWSARGELLNTITPLDAAVAWDAAKGPHLDTRIVYAGSIDGMQGVILEGSGRMALLVRATPDAPFTVLDDRFVRQNGGLRELSALGRPLLKGGKLAPYQIVFAVVHAGDVVTVKSPGLAQPGTPSYAILARVPVSATRGDTSLVITGGSTTVNVPLDASSG